ncbi:MAG: kynureninase [Actinobacteria bacterium]|nr:kynureninase [Actinomycetota bacterium]MBO0837038.1 kynureninase [Actinomycetota bacterium]
MSFSADRSYAESLDAADQLGHFRDRFVRPNWDDLIYLNGNSLGPLPVRTQARIAEVIDQEWGIGLVRSWDGWIQLPRQAGDMLAEHLLGAEAGEVIVCDSVTVNLYKLAWAALDARPGRSVIVTDDDNFPTDRYVLAGIAAQRDCELRLIHSDIDEGVSEQALAAALDDSVALVELSHVAYRSGALADMARLTRMAHESGALVLWDLCHSAGAVPVQLDADGADLAVGCTYKYINAGPGAPAFLYVRDELQHQLRQPIWGWFGQRDQFEMGPRYDPAPGITAFLAGTPDIVGAVAVEEGARLLAEAGMPQLRAKSTALTDYLISLADTWLAELDIALASPRAAGRRGGHVSLRHDDAWQLTQALLRTGVVADYRTPSRIRLSPAPLFTSFTQVWDSMDRLREIAESKSYADIPAEPAP